MCGIFGHYNLAGADTALVERMAQTLAHRGPDGYGLHSFGPLAFGAGRLAIIDLNAGMMPIFSEDRRVAVVYNGEIYNYKALRTELEARGHFFATGTDTEVIVHGYEEWGLDILARLRGMFAIGLWDDARQRLLLARDRMGEKPLYYAQAADTFLFASEIKGLFQSADLRREVNRDVIPLYLSLGYVPPPMTMFAGVEKLAPGEMLLLENRHISKQRFWTATMDTTRPPVTYGLAVRQVREMLTEAVEMRLMSDVPIGAFLSGGVDSTAVVGLMSRAMGRPVQTFTVGFDMQGGSEGDDKFNVDARYASLAAEHLRTDHHAITIRQSQRLSELLPYMVFALDEPLAQPAIIQTSYVAALARSQGVPVILSGDASDELFAGYTHYRADQVLARYLRVPQLLRNSLLTPLLERAPHDGLSKLARKSRRVDPVQRYLEWLRVVDPAQAKSLLYGSESDEQTYRLLSSALSPVLNHPVTHHFTDRIAYTSLRLWVAEDSNMRVDKMTSAMSVEARAPFQDHLLVDYAFQLPLEYKLRRGDFKRVLKDAVQDMVPAEILNRPKWGFMPPASRWLRTHLRPLVESVLAPERVEAAGCFRPAAVAEVIDSHINRRDYRLFELWALLVFHLWHQLYIDESRSLAHRFSPDDLLV